MDRWGWVALRAYGPAVFVLLAAVTGSIMLSHWPTSPLLAGFAGIARWAPMLALVVVAGLAVAPTYRILQWQRGEHLSCPSCGGPLGHERIGRARMGGEYRRCYACGKNVNHRHYESS